MYYDQWDIKQHEQNMADIGQKLPEFLCSHHHYDGVLCDEKYCAQESDPSQAFTRHLAELGFCQITLPLGDYLRGQLFAE